MYVLCRARQATLSFGKGLPTQVRPVINVAHFSLLGRHGHHLFLRPFSPKKKLQQQHHHNNNNNKGRLLDEDEGGGTVASSALVLGEEGGSGAVEPPPPPMVYSIRSGDNRIGSFILHKAEFCAGDIVLGNFDFSEASTRCLQVREREAPS